MKILSRDLLSRAGATNAEQRFAVESFTPAPTRRFCCRLSPKWIAIICVIAIACLAILIVGLYFGLRKTGGGNCTATLDCPWIEQFAGSRTIQCDNGRGQYKTRDCKACFSCNIAQQRPTSDNAFICVAQGRPCVPR